MKIIEDGNLVKIEKSDIKDGKIVIPSSVKTISGNCLDAILERNVIKEIEMEEGVETICDEAFAGLNALESVKFPKSLNTIGQRAFTKCKKLTQADLPDNIEHLGAHAFSYTNLQRVRLPESLKTVGYSAFSKCENLTEADLEFKINKIPMNFFLGCSSLKKVNLSKEIKEIGNSAFAHCRKLQEIDLSNVEHIGDRSFADALCGEVRLDNIITIDNFAFAVSHLIKVSFSDYVELLGDYAFFNSKLVEVKLPKRAAFIHQGVFSSCNSLVHADLNGATELTAETFELCENLQSITGFENLKTIGRSCFDKCFSLKDGDFIENVESIGPSAFTHAGLNSLKLNKAKELGEDAFLLCEQLKSVDLSQSELKNISKDAFQYCNHLQNVKLPQNCEILEESCFDWCERLKNIELPESLRSIGPYAFRFSGLKSASIPKNAKCEIKTFNNCSSLQEVEVHAKEFNVNNLSECRKLKTVKLEKDCKLSGTLVSANRKFKTIQKGKDGFIFSRKKTILNGYDEIASIKDYSGIEPVCIQILWDKRKKLLGEVKKAKLRDFYQNMYLTLDNEKFRDLMKNLNLKFYKKISILNLVDENNINRPPISEMSEVFSLFYYNLGGFNAPQKEKRISKSGNEVEVNVDYAQRVGEFFKNQLEKKNIRLGKLIENLANSMEIKGFKPEFTKFFIEPKNYEAMMEEEYRNPGFIAECYNKFEEVQETNTSNRGSQRQLKPTVDKFIDYFREEKFRGVTSATAPIARAISPYFSLQETFEDAVKIDRERKEKDVPDDILENPVKEEDVFEYIQNYSKKITTSAAKATKVVTEISENPFVTEWLKKSDPKNFILGKLCDCCAHLEGAGYGIMHASIVDPDVQNLVIKNSDGKIIAKSTLYVNRNQGYGVFNNVEISHEYGYDNDSLLKIHQKYKIAAAVFAQKYNKEHPSKPIQKITVGMGNNDLQTVIYKKDKRADHPLSAIRYSKFGGSWNGDSAGTQYTVWENNERE